MSDDFGVPELGQDLYQTRVEALAAELRDIGCRAAAFDELMASARGFRADGDRIHPDLSAPVWFAAVEVSITSRAQRPTSRETATQASP